MKVADLLPKLLQQARGARGFGHGGFGGTVSTVYIFSARKKCQGEQCLGVIAANRKTFARPVIRLRSIQPTLNQSQNSGSLARRRVLQPTARSHQQSDRLTTRDPFETILQTNRCSAGECSRRATEHCSATSRPEPLPRAQSSSSQSCSFFWILMLTSRRGEWELPASSYSAREPMLRTLASPPSKLVGYRKIPLQAHFGARKALFHTCPRRGCKSRPRRMTPNPSFELTRYSVAPRLPKGRASRIVPLVSQGATPPRAAQFQR